MFGQNSHVDDLEQSVSARVAMMMMMLMSGNRKVGMSERRLVRVYICVGSYGYSGLWNSRHVKLFAKLVRILFFKIFFVFPKQNCFQFQTFIATVVIM